MLRNSNEGKILPIISSKTTLFILSRPHKELTNSFLLSVCPAQSQCPLYGFFSAKRRILKVFVDDVKLFQISFDYIFPSLLCGFPWPRSGKALKGQHAQAEKNSREKIGIFLNSVPFTSFLANRSKKSDLYSQSFAPSFLLYRTYLLLMRFCPKFLIIKQNRGRRQEIMRTVSSINCSQPSKRNWCN